MTVLISSQNETSVRCYSNANDNIYLWNFDLFFFLRFFLSLCKSVPIIIIIIVAVSYMKAFLVDNLCYTTFD